MITPVTHCLLHVTSLKNVTVYSLHWECQKMPHQKSYFIRWAIQTNNVNTQIQNKQTKLMLFEYCAEIMVGHWRPTWFVHILCICVFLYWRICVFVIGWLLWVLSTSSFIWGCPGRPKWFWQLFNAKINSTAKNSMGKIIFAGWGWWRTIDCTVEGMVLWI